MAPTTGATPGGQDNSNDPVAEAIRQVQECKTIPEGWIKDPPTNWNVDAEENYAAKLRDKLKSPKVAEEIRSNERKLVDHSIDALVLMGLSKQIRAFKMLDAWNGLPGDVPGGTGCGPKIYRTRWDRIWSKDPRVKLSSCDFHFADLEDAEEDERKWEFLELWYWQYRLLKFLTTAKTQIFMLVVLSIDTLAFSAEGYFEGLYFESKFEEGKELSQQRSLSQSEWDALGTEEYRVAEFYIRWFSFVLLSMFLIYDFLRVVATGRYFLFSGKFIRSLTNVLDILLVALPWYGYLSVTVAPQVASVFGTNWTSILVIFRGARTLYQMARTSGVETQIEAQKARTVRLVVQKKGWLIDSMSDYYDAFLAVDQADDVEEKKAEPTTAWACFSGCWGGPSASDSESESESESDSDGAPKQVKISDAELVAITKKLRNEDDSFYSWLPTPVVAVLECLGSLWCCGSPKKKGKKKEKDLEAPAWHRKKRKENDELLKARTTIAIFNSYDPDDRCNNNRADAGDLNFREFVKMLICRQDTTFDQEVKEAFSLLTCDQHLLGAQWITKHLKDKYGVKVSSSKKEARVDLDRHDKKNPGHNTTFVCKTLESKRAALKQFIKRAEVDRVFDEMKKGGPEKKDIDDVKEGFLAAKKKREKERLHKMGISESTEGDDDANGSEGHVDGPETDDGSVPSTMTKGKLLALVDETYVPGAFSEFELPLGEVRSGATLSDSAM